MDSYYACFETSPDRPVRGLWGREFFYRTLIQETEEILFKGQIFFWSKLRRRHCNIVLINKLRLFTRLKTDLFTLHIPFPSLAFVNPSVNWVCKTVAFYEVKHRAAVRAAQFAAQPTAARRVFGGKFPAKNKTVRGRALYFEKWSVMRRQLWNLTIQQAVALFKVQLNW